MNKQPGQEEQSDNGQAQDPGPRLQPTSELLKWGIYYFEEVK